MFIGDYEMYSKSIDAFKIVLRQLKISEGSIDVLHTLPIRPEDTTKLPSIDLMRKHRENLLNRIERKNPDTIIILGNIALKTLFDSNSISIGNERGKLLKWNGRNIIPTYHPAYAVRKGEFGKWIYADIKNGLALIKNEGMEDKIEYKLINQKNRNEAMIALTKTEKVVIDLETTGLDPFDPKGEILMVGFCNEPGKAWVYPLEENNGCLDFTQRLLTNINLVIGHNIKFDLKWLLTRKLVYKGPIFDTLVAIHLLDENYPDKSLKSLARTELGEFGQQQSKHEAIIKAHWKAKTEPTMKEWLPYCGGDTIATFRLYEIFEEALIEHELNDLMFREMKVLKVLTYMEMNGFHISKEAFKRLEKEYEDLIYQSERKIKRVLGDINLGSSKQLNEVLYTKMKLPILEETPTGAPSSSEATLQALMRTKLTKENKTALELLLKFRNYSKLYNTYIKGMVENGLIKSDNKVHTNYKITGTVTGRLSCSDPNLQNIPREGNIKLMFTSRFPKGSIIQGDYSQAELRLLAHHAKSESLIQAFKSGRDIHREVAAKVFKKAYDSVTEQERKFAKQVSFGIVYCISGAGLAEKLNISARAGEKLIYEFLEEFPEIEKWIRKMKNQVVDHGFTENIFGRKRRFFSVNENTGEGREAQRQGVNSPIQGGAGDLTKWGMMKTYHALKKAGLNAVVIGNVHDAIMIDSPREEVREAVKILYNIATNPPIQLLVPMEMDIKVGPSWGELEKYELKEKKNGKE